MNVPWTALLLGLLLPCLTLGDNRPVGRSFLTRSEVLAQHGIACTSQPLATQAALEILKQGGSAIDAAIAADAVLGVVGPMNFVVGGVLFATVRHRRSNRRHGLNASCRSPHGLTLDHSRRNNLPK